MSANGSSYQSGKPRDDVERVLRLDIELGVVGAQMRRRRRLACSRLVVAGGVKADGEGLHRPRALRLHQRDDGRGIDAAGEKRAERHVGDHPQLDGIAQQRIEPLDRLVLVRRRIVARLAGERDAAQVPEAFQLRRRACAQRQDMAGRQLRGLAIDGARLRDIAVPQIARDRIVVDRRLPAGDGAKRLELRRRTARARASRRSRAA